VRLFCLDNESLSLDEFKAYLTSLDILSATHVKDNCFTLCSSPFFYLVLWGWLKIFPAESFSVRLFSVFFSITTLYLSYITSRLFLSRFQAMAGFIIFCFSAYHIYFAQELSVYSFLLFLIVLNQYSFFLIIKKGVFKKYLFVFIISLLCANCTDYTSLVLVPAQYFILRYLISEKSKFPITIWLKSVIIMIIISLVFYFIAISGLITNQITVANGKNMVCPLSIFKNIIFGFWVNGEKGTQIYYVILFAAVCYSFYQSLFIFKKNRKLFELKPRNRFSFCCLIFIGFQIFVPFCVDYINLFDYNKGIYICAIYSIYALIGAGVALNKYSFATIILIISICAVNIDTLLEQHSIKKNIPYKDCANWLNSVYGKKDIFITTESDTAKILQYYGFKNIDVVNSKTLMDLYRLNIILRNYDNLWFIMVDERFACSLKSVYDVYYPVKLKMDFVSDTGKYIGVLKYSLK